MIGKLRFRRSSLFATGLASFLAGIGIARMQIPVPNLLLVVIGLSVFGFSWRRNNIMTFAALILLGLTLGYWRGSWYMKQIRPYQIFSKRTVIVEGVADSDALYGKQTQLSFDLTQVRIIKPEPVNLPGKIAILGFGIPMVYRGDRVQIEGKLYPTRGSRLASISFSQIKLIGSSHSVINDIRRKFQTGMLSALPEPHASFAMGLLIGQRNTLPETVTKQLSAVGLTHIVAVSGYNLTIIIIASRALLKKRSKYQSTAIPVLLIITFLLLTGLSASIVRAAIVSSLSLMAWYYGRQIRPIVLILVAAVLTVGWYPVYLWSDIGWYLSFLAFYGILILAPLVVARVYSARRPQFASVLVIETLSAQLMTFPIIMYIFGEFSVIALIANLLIVPLVPLAMLLSLSAGLSGLLLPGLSGWLAFASRLLLTYMLDLIALLSRLPFALAKPHISLRVLLMTYSVILFVSFVLWRKCEAKSDIITDIEEQTIEGT